MEVSPSVQKMLAMLKQELRARGLRNRDVASRLGVSEVTVKRYLSGKGVGIATLERLAGLVDLDLLSLAALAKQGTSVAPELSKVQQAALGGSKLMAAVYILLLREWPQPRIIRELKLSKQGLEAVLSELEDLRIIRRVADEGIIVLAKPNVDQKGGSQLKDLWRDRARAFLSDIDLDDPTSDWFYNGFRLSSASSRQLGELIRQLVADVRTLDKNDGELPPEDVKWYRLFIGAQPSKGDPFDTD